MTTPDYDRLLDKYINRIQVSDPSHPNNKFVGGAHIHIMASAKEVEDIQEILGFGHLYIDPQGRTHWRVTNKVEGKDFAKSVANELMTRFELRGQYGAFRSLKAGRNWWNKVFS